MRILLRDVARCGSDKCKSKHLCLRWVQNGDGNMLWYSNFDVEYDNELGKCPYFVGE